MSDFFSIHPKYFDRVNHYGGDRQMIWIKLYVSFLDDVDFSLLADEQKYHFLGLMLLAARLDNRLPNNQQFLSQKISASNPIDLNLLVSKGFLVASESLADCYQNAIREEIRGDKDEIRKDEKKIKKNRKDEKKGTLYVPDEKLELEESDLSQITKSDRNNFINFSVEQGFSGDVIEFGNKTQKGEFDGEILKLKQDNIF